MTQAYYRKTPQQALEAQNASAEGLSAQEARRRAEQYGPNKLSLDEGQAAAPAVFLQQVAGGVPAQEEEVQVAAFGPDDLAVKHGVDIVRAALEGHRPGPPVDQGLEKGAGDGGLAAPAGGGAEEQTGRAHARPSPEKIQTGFWASIRW